MKVNCAILNIFVLPLLIWITANRRIHVENAIMFHVASICGATKKATAKAANVDIFVLFHSALIFPFHFHLKKLLSYGIIRLMLNDLKSPFFSMKAFFYCTINGLTYLARTQESLSSSSFILDCNALNNGA